MSLFPITLLVMTYNEAHNIARCLESVPFVAEKIVVDCGSTDETVQIAEAHGARVVKQPWLGFGAQRNFATGLAGYDWILFLDADEELTPELVLEFERRLPEILESNVAGAKLRRAAWYMGAPMRWYRPMVGEPKGRFYHRKRASWADVRVHESLRFDGPVLEFAAAFRHHHNPTLVHKHFKIMRYSDLKALDWKEQGRSLRMWQCPFVYFATFFKDYVFHLAIFDGWRGFAIAHVAANYAVYKRLRYYEMTINPESRELAAQLLAQYDLER